MVDDLSQITIEKLDKKISKCENLGLWISWWGKAIGNS